MHMTNEVTIVPPLATAKRNRIPMNPQYHGIRDAAIPKRDWSTMQISKVFFRPCRSANIPKNIFPAKLHVNKIKTK